MSLIPDNNRSKINGYLERFKDIVAPSGSYELDLTVDAIIQILAQIVSFPPKVESYLDPDEKRSIITSALFRWRKYSTTDLRTFQTALRTEIEHFSKLAKKPHKILFFMNAHSQSFAERPIFSVLGHTFRIQTHEYIQAHFQFNEFITHVRHVSLIPEQLDLNLFIPILVEGEWRDSRQAIEETVVVRADFWTQE